ncbi:hypothetical protein ACJRO7_020604 [Eucalyptus globulus]|uniref:Uncharacterized protein n=1 Tax=Eucalyptus globulus TaxID=34317 RepID=A0ABD3KH95_EUCGL
MFDSFNRKSPPIAINHSLPAPSVVSSSCIFNVSPADEGEKKENRSQEEVSSPCSWLSFDSFPTQTCNYIQESFSFSVVNNSGACVEILILPDFAEASDKQ